jgi:response regulator RpfG family c-di-GMP phosphodiesterase
LVILTEQQNGRLRRLNVGLEEQVAQRTVELECIVAELRKLSGRLRSDVSSTVRLISGLIEQRGGLTARCSIAIARHVHTLGPTVGVVGDALRDLTFAALLQDLGKLALPDALVRQPLQALDSDARQRVLHHPQAAQRSLSALPSLHGACTVLGHLNANFDGHRHTGGQDGRGHPDRLEDLARGIGLRALPGRRDRTRAADARAGISSYVQAQRVAIRPAGRRRIPHDDGAARA